MGVLLALYLTFDGVQNVHIMELHFAAAAAAAKSLQLCPTLCDPMDCSLPDRKSVV